MKVLALCATVLLLPQERNEAHALLKKMESKLLDAKTLQLKVEGTSRLSNSPVTLKSSLLIGEDNRFQFDLDVAKSEGNVIFQAVSDGSKWKTSIDKFNIPIDVPPNLKVQLVEAFFRSGTLFCARWLEAMADKEDKRPEFRKLPDYANFKMGRKEKMGGRDVQLIHFTIKGPDNPVSVSLWIDVGTTLPVKRELRGMQGVVDVTTVETFSELKLDEKIDPAKFELPKPK